MRLFLRCQFALGAVYAALLLLAVPNSWARIGIDLQAPLGNPDGAVTDAASRTRYLIKRAQFNLSYNDDTHQANWVGWSITTNGLGAAGRTDAWAVEELLPAGYLRIGTSTFGTHFGIQWDRGHMAPSADRTQSIPDNEATFRMSNIIPQASANNQGLWANFENYCRTNLALNNREVIIISGPSEFTGNRIPNSMAVAGSVWKIAVVATNATSTNPASTRIGTNSRVIAIMTPNVSDGLGSWQSYITSVEEIEEVTGLNFFTSVDPSVAIYLKNVVDSGTGPNNPTVVTTFSPTLGNASTQVTISGYNFNGSSTVQFNGQAAAVSFVNSNTLTATVPAGATTGPITVTGPGGTDTSYEDFTVTTGAVNPVITVSPVSISGMTSTEGSPGAVQNYAVNGSNLTASVVIAAPTNFELSTDGATYSSSLTLTPAIDGSLGTQINVRIKSNAPVGAVSGTITHVSSGATTQNVSVAGTVASSAPHIAVSTSSLTGFSALLGSAGGSKSYTVSGANLGGSITITAPGGYEVSLDNSAFAAARTLTPVNGTLATTTVFARLSTTAPLGSNTGSISHAGGGAATQNVSVSGTVSTSGGATSDVYWDFQTAAPTSGVPDGMTVGSLSQGNNNGTTTLLTTTSASSGYTGASGNNNAGAAARIGALNTASSGSAYFEFTVTPASAGIFTLAGISFGTRSTSTGPQAYAVRSSEDNYASDIATGSISNNSTWALKSNTGLGQTYSSATTFRLYGYGGTGSATAGTANWRIDDLKISVSTGSSSTPVPVITVSGTATATALQSFTYQIEANNSPTSYGASGLPEGLSVNASTGEISGTPTTPGSYTVGLTASNAGGDGTATLTINVQTNPAAPSITSNLIAYGQIDSAFSYQITAANSPKSYTAANLPAGLTINTSTGVISGTPTAGGSYQATISAFNEFGSDAETLQITVRVPTLTLTPAQLSPFSANVGFHSTTQSYTLSGSELTETILVRAPQYFEISTDGATFSSEIPVSPDGDETLTRSIIVRLADSAPPGSVTGAISHAGSGATPKYLEVTGTVSTSEPTLTVSTASLAPFTTDVGTASAIQTYEVSGASLEGIVTITPPAGFEVGTDDESFGVGIELTPSVTGALTPTAIYVRLRDDAAAGTYSGVITHSGGNASAQAVSVSGTVSVVSGPNIVATSGGSVRVSTSYSYTIRTDGAQTVTSYGATGLPAGLSVNSSTGVISGTPSVAGTYNVILRATSSQGTSTKPYTIRVVSAAEQPGTPSVVINKYHNATVDRVELLVAGDNTAGPPVDLRGMIVKDFNSNMATDGGGKYVFADHPLWSNVKAGTLIVLAAGNTLSEDVDPSDWVLRVNLSNHAYFTEESGGFDIGNIDMIMIKPAGMQPDGTAGGWHALAAGTTAEQYDTFSGPKTRARRELSANRGYYCYVVNSNGTLNDFSVSLGADVFTSLALGTAHTSGNSTFITSLRALDQDPPVITLNGANPLNLTVGETYTEPGATAFDVRDNASKAVTVSGTVNTSVAGTYTVTYTATDSRGNAGTATRTVNLSAPASATATVATSGADATLSTTAMLIGNVQNQGSSAVTARGFVYSTVAVTLELGADGTATATAGSGTGAFNAELTSLSPGTTYYFRAYATSDAGTAYGETLSFTTLKAEPLNHAADFAAGTITTVDIPATWTGTEADGYLLVVGSGVLTTPGDGIPVADDTDVSDGHGAVNLPSSATSYGGFTGFAPGTTYSFRLYPYNNSGSAIDYKIGDAPSFTAGVATTPELSVSGSLAPLTTIYGTPSSSATFTVSGVYLTSTVSITAPPGIEVSADNTTFDTSITLTPSSGTLAATTVYLRLAATASVAGTYDGRAINISSVGAETVTTATAASGNAVSAKELAVSGLSASDKVYDGTTGVSIVGTPAYEGLANDESFPVGGIVTWAFADTNIGAGKTLARTGSFTAPSANYTIATQPTLAASITAKPLTVTASVVTKAYDGNTAATITGATLTGVIEGDVVTVSGGGAFNDANAGENKPVTADLTLGGAGAGNYTLTQPGLTGTITKADQTITFAELPGKSPDDAPFSLTGTASSGLAVSYASSNPDVASVSGSMVTILSAGTTTITAEQGGDGNHNAAVPVARVLTVTDAPRLIAGWDFQTTANGGTAAATNSAPVIYQANFGAGSLHLDGAHGSSTWIISTNAATNQVSAFSGTTVNAAPGFSADTASPASLALLAGASNSANGNSIVFKVDMSGRKDLGVSYASRGTSGGFTTHTWSVSTNASDWTQVSVQTGRTDTNFTAITLPVITNGDNAANVYLRLTVTGATSSTGNNRIDNVQLVAVTHAATDTTPPVITISGDNPLTLAAGSTFTDPGATALDETDGPVDVSASGEVNAAMPGDYTITYSATDAAGNTATATRTVTVIDGTAPVITVAGEDPLYLPVGATFIEPGVSALDAIDGNVEVQTSGTVDTGMRGSYTLTYTASDAANNTATGTRTVIVRAGATHAFETQYGMSGAGAALTADADQDGVPNLMEYAFGSDPASAADTPAANGLTVSAGAVRFSAIVRGNDNALRITPMVAPDLRSAWSSTSANEIETIDQTNVPAGFRRRTWEVPGAEAAALFIRFEVSYD